MSHEQTALELIALERQRQIDVEGWTIEHDDAHTGDELAIAAAAYALPADLREGNEKGCAPEDGHPPWFWSWDRESWKPTPDDRIRELVKASALLVADIERLLRKG